MDTLFFDFDDGPFETDTILAALDDEHEVLYRIRRTDERIVYVRIISKDLFPPNKREHGPDAMAELCKLPMWNDPWETLEISTVKNGVSYKLDSWKPHTVPEKHLLPYYPRCDHSNLPIIRPLHSRTYEVDYDNIPSVMKVANFPFQIPLLIRELKMYHALGGSPLAPNLLAYVCESHDSNRIIGFVIDKLEGHWAGPKDLDACARSLRYMHTIMLYGNLNKRSIVMTKRGPKFISFKHAQLATDENWEAREQERRSLAAVLGATTTTERGRTLHREQ